MCSKHAYKEVPPGVQINLNFLANTGADQSNPSRMKDPFPE